MALNYQAAVNISADFTGQRAIDQAKRGLNDLNGSVNGVGNVFGSISGKISGFGAALGGLGAALAIKELVQFGKGVINLGDNLNDLRQKTGIGVQALSDLKAAAEDGGVDFGSLEGSLRKFSVTLAKANSGSDQAQAGFKALGISVTDASGNLKASDQVLLEIADKFSNIPDGADKAAVAVALFGRSGADLIPVLNGGRDAIRGMGQQMSDEFAKQSDIFNDNLNKIGRGIAGFGTTILEKALPYLNQFLDYVSRIRITNLGITVDPPKTTSNGGTKGDRLEENKTGKIDTRFLAGSNDKTTENRLDRERDQIAKLNVDLKELTELRELEAQKNNLSAAEYDRRKLAIQGSADAEKATINFSKENAAAYDEVTRAITDQKQALVTLQEQQKQSFGEGAKDAFNTYLENAKNVSAQTKNLFSDAFSGMEDAIVNFVQTGKLSFEDLARQIEADLIRIAIRQAIVFGANAVAGAAGGGGFAFAGGGVMTASGPMPLKKYASGGVANSPQLALFGEGSRPEAFVPLPDGRSIPVSMKDGGGSGGTSVVVNVNMVKGGKGETTTQSDTESGKQLGNLISARVTEELIKQKRPGGLLA